MPIMEVKILPLGTKTASVSEYVVNALKVLNKNDIKYELTSMGTIMEADSVEYLFDMAKQMHKAALSQINRVVTFIELDERIDKELTIEGKLKSAQEKLMV